MRFYTYYFFFSLFIYMPQTRSIFTKFSLFSGFHFSVEVRLQGDITHFNIGTVGDDITLSCHWGYIHGAKQVRWFRNTYEQGHEVNFMRVLIDDDIHKEVDVPYGMTNKVRHRS